MQRRRLVLEPRPDHRDRALAGGEHGAARQVERRVLGMRAGQAFPSELDFAASKIAVFIASILSAMIGTALLWSARTPDVSEEQGAATAPGEPALGTMVNE